MSETPPFLINGLVLAALPESLLGSSRTEALEAIVELDLTDLAGVEPPRGYGRD